MSAYRDLATPVLVRVPDIELVPEWGADPRLTVLMPHLALAQEGFNQPEENVRRFETINRGGANGR